MLAMTVFPTLEAFQVAWMAPVGVVFSRSQKRFYRREGGQSSAEHSVTGVTYRFVLGQLAARHREAAHTIFHCSHSILAGEQGVLRVRAVRGLTLEPLVLDFEGDVPLGVDHADDVGPAERQDLSTPACEGVADGGNGLEQDGIFGTRQQVHVSYK
jgi:hypothetical protein